MTTKNGTIQHFDQSDCLLEPGELVAVSGIYEICHVDVPRATVVLTRNSFFPFCRDCGEAVRYKLVLAVPHISEDPDFMEDSERPDNPDLEMAVPTNQFPLQLGRSHGFRFQQEAVSAGRSGPEIGDL